MPRITHGLRITVLTWEKARLSVWVRLVLELVELAVARLTLAAHRR